MLPLHHTAKKAGLLLPGGTFLFSLDVQKASSETNAGREFTAYYGKPHSL